MRSTRATSPTRAAGRVAAVVGIAAAVAVTTPGVASAGNGTVHPLAQCWRDNGDDTFTVVFGYTNDESTAVDIPVGPDNTTDPRAWESRVPTHFEPGTHYGVANVVLTRAQAEGRERASWTLDGTTLDANNTRNVPQCSESEMPQFASGAALVGALGVAGVVGAVAVRRNRGRGQVAGA